MVTLHRKCTRPLTFENICRKSASSISSEGAEPNVDMDDFDGHLDAHPVDGEATSAQAHAELLASGRDGYLVRCSDAALMLVGVRVCVRVRVCVLGIPHAGLLVCM